MPEPDREPTVRADWYSQNCWSYFCRAAVLFASAARHFSIASPACPRAQETVSAYDASACAAAVQASAAVSHFLG
ncbi:hypothetical protein OHQ89_19300 [Streptomyces canus]